MSLRDEADTSTRAIRLAERCYAMKPTYDADKGQYVLQIRSTSGWQEYLTLKSQSDLNAAIIRAKCCRGAGNRPGEFRVVHQFMGTTVLADYTQELD